MNNAILLAVAIVISAGAWGKSLTITPIDETLDITASVRNTEDHINGSVSISIRVNEPGYTAQWIECSYLGRASGDTVSLPFLEMPKNRVFSCHANGILRGLVDNSTHQYSLDIETGDNVSGNGGWADSDWYNVAVNGTAATKIGTHLFRVELPRKGGTPITYEYDDVVLKIGETKPLIRSSVPQKTNISFNVSGLDGWVVKITDSGGKNVVQDTPVLDSGEYHITAVSGPYGTVNGQIIATITTI